MTRLLTWLSVSLFLASVVAAPRLAAAEPSLWQRAENPMLKKSERLLRRVGRFVEWVSEADGDADMRHDFWLGALVTAEQSGAHALPDPRIRLVLARVLLGADLGREAEAAALARAVLADAGPGSAWLEAEARMLLVEAAQDPTSAIAEVGRALPLVWDSRSRSDLYRRRADAKMALGDLRGGLLDYREALRADDSARRRALARFGIGLALERAGNLPEAMTELRLARLAAPRMFGVELGVLALPGVFDFRPEDVHYVVGLVEQGRIPNLADPDADLGSCERAVSGFREYLAAASAEDPYLERAAHHQRELGARCDDLRRRAERAPAEPE
jgi:tetratricopeptide (TPR) repeat protein